MLLSQSFLILIASTTTITALVSQQPLTSPSSTSLSSLLSLHKRLVEIPSVTGTENEIADYLSSYLEHRNFTTHLQPVHNPQYNTTRHNVLAYPNGCSNSTPVLLTSHIDTVPPFIPYRRTSSAFSDEDLNDEALDALLSTGPHSEAVKNITILGRGSSDAAASVATQIHALLHLLSTSFIPRCSTSLLFVVGEEVSGDGMLAANALNPGWKSVIFGEPTENKLAAGHKGNLGMRLEVEGQSGHSGYPWLSVSANDVLVDALAAVRRLGKGEQVGGKGLARSEKYGNSTVNIGKIEGGVAGNVIASRASALVTARLAGGDADTAKEVLEAAIEEGVREVVDKAREKGKHVSWSAEYTKNGYGPVDLDTDVKVWEDEGQGFTVNYGTDVPNLEGEHRRYLYGPGSILVAHGDHEMITVGDLAKGLEGYKRLLKGVLKRVDGGVEAFDDEL